jgi:hypothetical protein
VATDYRKEAKAIKDRLAGRVKDIEQRRDLSAEGRKRQLSKVAHEASESLRKLQRDAAKATEQRRAKIMKDLFGNPTAYDSTSTISYRDALDRAERVKSAEEAARLLERARTIGDAALARAVAAKALDRAMADPTGGGEKWAAIANEWGAEDPERDALLTELGQLHSATGASSRITEQMEYSAPRPAGLSAADDIGKLAGEADQNPTENEPPDIGAEFGWTGAAHRDSDAIRARHGGF